MVYVLLCLCWLLYWWFVCFPARACIMYARMHVLSVFKSLCFDTMCQTSSVSNVCVHVLTVGFLKSWCLACSSRPWGFEFSHAHISWENMLIYYGSTHDSMYLAMGFETLALKFCELKLWALTVCVRVSSPQREGRPRTEAVRFQRRRCNLTVQNNRTCYLQLLACIHYYQLCHIMCNLNNTCCSMLSSAQSVGDHAEIIWLRIHISMYSV